jgi:hypothetical protein
VALSFLTYSTGTAKLKFIRTKERGYRGYPEKIVRINIFGRVTIKPEINIKRTLFRVSFNLKKNNVKMKIETGRLCSLIPNIVKAVKKLT